MIMESRYKQDARLASSYLNQNQRTIAVSGLKMLSLAARVASENNGHEPTQARLKRFAKTLETILENVKV